MKHLSDKSNSQALTRKIWKQFFVTYMLPRRKLFAALILSALLVAGGEASLTLITKSVIDKIMNDGANADLSNDAILYFTILSLLGLFIWAFILMAGKISTTMRYLLRQDSFSHMQELSFSYFDQKPVGWLMARLTSDCQRLTAIVAWGTLDICWAVPFLLGICGVMFYLDWKLALIVLTIIPVLLAVSLYFQQVILRSSRKVRSVNSKLTASYNEGITSVETSKTLVRENDNLAEFKVLSKDMFAHSFINGNQAATYLPFVISLGSIGTGLALSFGGSSVIAGIMTLGTLVTFMAYTNSLHDPILELARNLTELQTATAAAERVFSLVNASPEITDSEAVNQKIALTGKTIKGVPYDGGRQRISTIELKDVSFEYTTDHPIIQDVNLKIQSGSSIALVGPTGGGKSTLVNLICRFYEPTSGQILLNDEDYRERGLLWYQSNLGIVLQTPFLFSGTIADNIRYGNLDATDDLIISAAKAVNAHSFITELPEGYQTLVGQEGKNLSTGQKQMISFARAILADPAILVMDEATSSVDTRTEKLIQDGLSKVLEGRTSFIIAHRLSTIRSADSILFIKDGQIMEMGNHAELLKLKGHYYKLCQRQISLESGYLYETAAS